jgi:hypothetical protein
MVDKVDQDQNHHKQIRMIKVLTFRVNKINHTSIKIIFTFRKIQILYNTKAKIAKHKSIAITIIKNQRLAAIDSK